MEKNHIFPPPIHNSAGSSPSGVSNHGSPKCGKTRKRVILHGIGSPSGSKCITESVFTLKVESFLRLVGQNYKFTTEDMFHPETGKTPWIEYGNDYMQHDSELIISFMKQYLDVDPDKNLTEEQLAISRGFSRMLSEGTSWCCIGWKFVWSDCGIEMFKNFLGKNSGRIMGAFAKWRCKKAVWHQGVGRLSKEEAISMALNDLNAISHYLGSKPFIFGDEIRTLDCSIFAFVTIILTTLDGHISRNPFRETIFQQNYNLICYMERVQTFLFPDWDVILNNPSYDRGSNRIKSV